MTEPAATPEAIEWIHHFGWREPPRLAVFDFDGTLSLIREGWQEIMMSMMLQELLPHAQEDTPEQIQDLIANFVMELTGKPTILQMVRLAEEIQKRGGEPLEAEAYRVRFQTKLDERCDVRRAELEQRTVDPQVHLVPGVLTMLEELAQRDIKLAVASGTDEASVRREIALLRIDHYFEDRIFAAPQGDPNFSKGEVMQKLASDLQLEPQHVVGFGDGVVETEAVLQLGGTAIGIAGDEQLRHGRIDPWKREQLVAAGAHVIMADFQHHTQIHRWLFDAAPK